MKVSLQLRVNHSSHELGQITVLDTVIQFRSEGPRIIASESSSSSSSQSYLKPECQDLTFSSPWPCSFRAQLNFLLWEKMSPLIASYHFPWQRSAEPPPLHFRGCSASAEGGGNPTSHSGDVIDSTIGSPQSYCRFNILTFKIYVSEKST